MSAIRISMWKSLKWIDRSGKLQPPVDRTLAPLQVNPRRKNVKGKGKVQEEGVVDDSMDDSTDDSVDDSLDDHSKAEASDVGTDGPSAKKVSGRRQNHAKTPFPSHSCSNPPPADGSHTNPDLHSGNKYTTELQDHSEYADEDGLESIPFTDHPTKEGSTSRKKGSVRIEASLGAPGSHLVSERPLQGQMQMFHLLMQRDHASKQAAIRSRRAHDTMVVVRGVFDIRERDSKAGQLSRTIEQRAEWDSPAMFISVVKQPKPSTANVRPIEPRQSSSCMKQSKNLEETLVQLHVLQEPTPPPIVSSGRADMVGSNMDITANSCESLVDQFLQEKEPIALAEGRIAADGMNVDLLEQLLNAQEPLALPVTHEKLNRMDRSSTPAQDVTMQDMREPTPPPLVSNVPVESFDLAADEDNGTNRLTFGMPKQSEMRDLFKEICNGELPSTQQSLQMEQWELAPVPCCDQVLHALHAMVSCYCRTTTPSNMLFDPTVDRHLVQAANAISVVEMGILYLACQIEVASVHLKQTADIAAWPVHWFANLAMDLLYSSLPGMLPCIPQTPR
ncbi:hypothetical protein F5J12DRAFT_786993 [Pisolithus orientalis]|uniref:uncharacterized protein n=1 Tax=Pisolithus orientalis TaxID=936130 RepID=UPI002224129E|nr:uncharacterized protein F5J12DRAFT_786993 [Pisolithus orientalis]KAI5987923.1 hypothetical protein F5J12DRAFT_786993 [Pisolithus orientalis]